MHVQILLAAPAVVTWLAFVGKFRTPVFVSLDDPALNFTEQTSHNNITIPPAN